MASYILESARDFRDHIAPAFSKHTSMKAIERDVQSDDAFNEAEKEYFSVIMALVRPRMVARSIKWLAIGLVVGFIIGKVL
jgi:hypothetical protein